MSQRLCELVAKSRIVFSGPAPSDGTRRHVDLNFETTDEDIEIIMKFVEGYVSCALKVNVFRTSTEI